MIGVTGGTGFIGSRLTAALRASGHPLRLFTRMSSRDHPDDDVRLLDISAPTIDPTLLAGCDTVIHLAAYVPRDHADPDEATRCWQINALGTLHLAQAAAGAGVRHFVHTTSANAYAAWEEEPAETAAMFPRSRGYYLGSKIMQEIYASEVCRAAGPRLATLRLGSVYGPGQPNGAVAALAAQAMAGEPIRLADEGGFGADFVHVDDVVTAIMLVIAQNGDGTFNVGSGIRSSIAEVAHRLVAAAKGDAAMIDRAASSARADLGFPALSIERLQRMGYVPRGLASGLSSMIAERETRAV